MAGVDPEALSFGFEVLVKDTDLDPLALEILAGKFVEGDHIIVSLSKKGEIAITKKPRV